MFYHYWESLLSKLIHFIMGIRKFCSGLLHQYS